MCDLGRLEYGERESGLSLSDSPRAGPVESADVSIGQPKRSGFGRPAAAKPPSFCTPPLPPPYPPVPQSTLLITSQMEGSVVFYTAHGAYSGSGSSCRNLERVVL